MATEWVVISTMPCRLLEHFKAQAITKHPKPDGQLQSQLLQPSGTVSPCSQFTAL